MDRRCSRVRRWQSLALATSPQEVYVTFLENKPNSNQKYRGEQMAKAREKLAEIKAFAKDNSIYLETSQNRTEDIHCS